MRRIFAVGFALCIAGTVHANCGSEGCPLQPFGPERIYGRWTFDAGFQSVKQDKLWDGSAESDETEGIGHVTERLTETQAWTGTVGFAITPRIWMQAVVPYLYRTHSHDLEHHAGTFYTSTWHMKGLGDASVLGNWHVTGEASSGVGVLTLQAGVKLPTGSTDAEEIDGEQPEPPARLGTGSTDGLFGATLSHAFDVPSPGGHGTMPVTVSVLGRVNGKGTEDYQVGDELLGNLTTTYTLTQSFNLLFQVNGVVHARDDVGNTDAEPHETGSETLYLTPGASVRLPGGIAAYGYWQIRTYAHTNGPQLVAPSHFLFGLNYALH